MLCGMVAVEKRGAEEMPKSPPCLMALKYFISKSEEDTVFH